MATTRLFSFRINNVAFKNIQPFLLEINKEKINPIVKFFHKIFGMHVEPRYVIKFKYKDQNDDFKSDNIFFIDKAEAEYWYSFIFDAVFLEKNLTAMPPKKPAPPAPNPKPKIKPLEKLNKPDHLKVVKDNDSKEDPKE